MENYRKLVKRLADEGSGEFIPNGGTEHAEVLIENIFIHAKNIVRVFSGELNARVYGVPNIVDSAKAFLQESSDNKLQILIQDYSEDDLSKYVHHDLIKMCHEDLDDDAACEIKSVNEMDTDVSSHFVIMDEIGYRFEPDREKPTAMGCFNDPESAKKLNKSFDVMFGRGKTLNLQPEKSSLEN